MEKGVGSRQILREAEGAKLVDGDAAPLDDGTDMPLGQMRFERVPVVAAHFVILEDVEMAFVGRGSRWKTQPVELENAAS